MVFIFACRVIEACEMKNEATRNQEREQRYERSSLVNIVQDHEDSKVNKCFIKHKNLFFSHFHRGLSSIFVRCWKSFITEMYTAFSLSLFVRGGIVLIKFCEERPSIHGRRIDFTLYRELSNYWLFASFIMLCMMFSSCCVIWQRHFTPIWKFTHTIRNVILFTWDLIKHSLWNTDTLRTILDGNVFMNVVLCWLSFHPLLLSLQQN